MKEPLVVRVKRGGWAEDWLRYLANAGDRVPLGPWNTYSNVAYAIVGAFIATRIPTEAGAAMGLALFVLATGSASYHAVKSRPANTADWVGMYMVAGAFTAHGLLVAVPYVSWLMLLAGGLLVAYYGHRKWMSADWHIAATIVLGSIRPFLAGGEARVLVVVSWGVFALAYGCWQLDKRHVRWMGAYGHALWHVLTAIALGVGFFGQEVAR